LLRETIIQYLIPVASLDDADAAKVLTSNPAHPGGSDPWRARRFTASPLASDLRKQDNARFS